MNGVKMNGFQKRTMQKKEAIISTATEHFFNEGVAGSSISQIAHEAGVSQVTIYNYFGSKNNLAREVFYRYMNHAMEEAEEIMSREIPFSEKLELLFSLQKEMKSPFKKAFLHTIPWDDPEIQQYYQEFANKRALPFIKRLIEQGKAEGAIHPSITWEAALAYISAVMSILTDPGFLKSSDEYKEAVHRLFYYGLLGSK